MSRVRKGTAAGAIALCVVGGFEGSRQIAYPDVIGVPTICYGETKGVQLGDRKTKAECDAMLVERLDEFAELVEFCITRPMPARVEVAFVSLAYNIGNSGFCFSSVARLYNEGRGTEACDAMLKFNRAGGVVFPGLTKRREKERALCLEGLREGPKEDA
jgi:lysozyme